MAGCTAIVAAATLLLYLVLYWAGEGEESVLRFVPYVALLLFAATPFCAAWLSDHNAALTAAAGGLAVGIGTTVAAAAAIERGGTGAMPLTLGLAVAGLIALRSNGPAVWARLVAVALIAAYASISERFVSALFVYPLLAFADELTDVVSTRRARAAVKS